jgi:hypothetical protein
MTPVGALLIGEVLPTAMAGAILWAARFSGKLNGAMNEQGPIGTRRHMPVYARARGDTSMGWTSP